MRIISLLPSATEILVALGFADRIVGISHDCDYPAEICDRPRVTASVLPEDLPSGEIHRSVQASASHGQTLYSIDAQRLSELEPDLVITQEQCSVCAVGRDDVELAVSHMRTRPLVISLSASRFSEVFDDILHLGRATRAEERAEQLIRHMRRRIDMVRRRVTGATRPRVFCLSWFDPLMAASHWLTDMVWAAGGKDGLGSSEGASRLLSIEQLQDYSPEVVVLMPCGISLERSVSEWQSARSIWANLTAAERPRVFAVDGSIFHRPGPRLVDGIELLAGLIHPLRFRRTYSDGVVARVA
jgi:iron complex transport system substrate-binding protein